LINNIVFFVASPLTNRDYERYGAEIFLGNGFNVFFYDVSPYLYPELHKKSVLHDRYDGDNVTSFYSKHEIIGSIKDLSKDTFVIFLMHYRVNSFFIYSYLSKLNLNYAISILNIIPNYPSSVRVIARHYLQISKFKPSAIISKIKNIIFSARFAKYLGIKSPSMLLLGGKASINHHQAALANVETKNLWLHTFDYDNYLNEVNNDKKINSKVTKKAVFIDSPSPRFKKDALIPGISNPLTEERFYPSLCRLFDEIESHLGVSVQIAGHPGSNHSLNPEYFGGRLTFSGNTCEMIKGADIVINRNSTAMNYAVIYNKPLIFITSNEAKKSNWLSSGITLMASSVGKIPINIDSLDNINWNDHNKIDKDAYSWYFQEYIKSNGNGQKYLWQIVASKIKELY